jgi:hypothetical protein
MKWDNLLMLPLAGFIQWPLAALAPAAVFAWLGYSKKALFCGVVAGLWALYAVYELMMKLRILCSGECNIRVDLLLIVPLLWICSIVAFVQAVRKKKGPHGAA